MVWSFVYQLLCFIGCAYLVINIFRDYLSYSTVTRTKFLAPTVITLPNLHFCIRTLYDAIDEKAVQVKYGINISSYSYTRRYDLYDNLSVADLLQLTPSFNISECVYRDEIGSDAVQLNAENAIFHSIFGNIYHKHMFAMLYHLRKSFLSCFHPFTWLLYTSACSMTFDSVGSYQMLGRSG